jgi:hypothetical protein
MNRLLLLPLVLACFCAEAVDVPPNTVSVELGKDNTLKVTRRTGNTSKTVQITVNKQDTVKIIEPVPVMHSGLLTVKIGLPPMDPGYPDLRVRNTTEEAPWANGGSNGAMSTFGAFRAVCGAAAVVDDDWLVHPNMPGGSHTHTVVGNKGFSAFTTIASLITSGNSTCRGGIANRSQYWVSSLVDMRTMKPRVHDNWLTYYKAGSSFPKGYGWADAAGVWHPSPGADGKPFPGFTTPKNGLRMIAGDPMAMAPRAANAEFSYRWKCEGGGMPTIFGSSIPDCGVGQTLVEEIFFPQCWDGVNLDSPNHKSHMAYPIQVRNEGDSRNWSHWVCPLTHPTVIPEISFSIWWTITEPGQAKNYRLSADSDLTLPAGIRAHGDLAVAWDEPIKESWMNYCIREGRDCHAHLVGPATPGGPFRELY